MKKIPFTIKVHNTTYRGYLTANDISEPPRNYLVFMENHMVGELMWRHKWIFSQGRWHKILGKLNEAECEEVAKYLGHITSLANNEIL